MENLVKDSLKDLIAKKLTASKEELRKQFHQGHENPTRYFYIDNLLPTEIAQKIADSFPKPDQMRLMKSFRETKYTSKSLEKFDPILKEITFAVQAPEVLKIVEEITGITDQFPDDKLYAGGLSLMTQGQFLNPHIDNSHDQDRKLYRTVNLLYYVTPNWKAEDGGHLELWDDRVKKPETVHSYFNRLVVMETNMRSWHSVSPVRPADGARRCVSNYYFSPNSPSGKDYYHVTSFSARPEQWMRRYIAQADGVLRNQLRRVFKGGFAKKDLYAHDAAKKDGAGVSHGQ